jgi:hypothetical protein
VDPATNIVEMARAESLEIVNEYFTPAVAVRIRDEYGPAAAILTANTFHHVDDLDSFTEGVALLLDMDGVFIIEVPYAADLVEQNEFDGIYHEHVSQFTVKSIVDLCRRFDLDVFRVVSLPVHGGSMRVFVRQGHGGKTLLPNVDTWLALERDKALLCAATYDSFAQRVQTIRRDLLAMLKQIKAEGKTVAGYGASARGNTLLNTYGIGPELLDYIVDRNHLKQGLYSPGMHIPVHSVEKLVEDQPDYVLIVAWNFAEEILIQQDEYRRRGGRFILPLPKPHILNGD